MNVISYPNIFNKNNRKLSTSLSYNIDAINQSLTAMFYVNQGELLGDPLYGTDIRKCLFDLKTQSLISDIKIKIINYINKHIPNIKTNTNLIKIYSNPNNTQFKITITYQLKTMNDYYNYETVVVSN